MNPRHRRYELCDVNNILYIIILSCGCSIIMIYFAVIGYNSLAGISKPLQDVLLYTGPYADLPQH